MRVLTEGAERLRFGLSLDQAEAFRTYAEEMEAARVSRMGASGG